MRPLGDATQTRLGRSPRQSFLLYLFAVLLALLGASYLGYSNIATSDTLDASWMVDNYLAVLRHAHFGTDYLWTYGPLGFADAPMAFADAPFEISRLLQAVVILMQVGFAILLGGLLVYLLTNVVSLPPEEVLLVTAGLLLPNALGFGFTIDFNAAISALILLNLALAQSKDGQASTVRWVSRQTLLVAFAGCLLAAAALMQLRFLPFALAVAGAWAINSALRRSWNLLLWFALSGIFVWFGVFALAGGGLASGVTWPVAAVPLVTGYSAAMGLESAGIGLETAGLETAGIVDRAVHAAAVIVGLLAAVCGVLVIKRKRNNWWASNWWAVGFVALLGLTAFKEAFTRQDLFHWRSFFLTLPWCVVLLWCFSGEIDSPSERGGDTQTRWMGPAATASVIGVIAISFLVTTVTGRFEFVKVVNRVASSTYAYHAEAKLRQKAIDLRSQDGQGLAALVPLLKQQRAFAWPWDGNAIVAAGGRQVFPPVPQELLAYTTSLDLRDATFFSSPARPPLGVVSVEAIDGRLPLQTAGMSFVQLLSCYRPMALSGRFLVVSAHGVAEGCPRTVPLEGQSSEWQRHHLGEWMRVPSQNSSLTMAQIRVEPSLWGRARNIASHLAPLYLDMQLADGTSHRFRVVHQTLPNGMLVSTLLSNTADLANLWLGDPTNSVLAIALMTDRREEWASTFTIRFIDIPAGHGPQSVDVSAPATSESASLIGHIESAKPSSTAGGRRWVLVTGWYDAGGFSEGNNDRLSMAVLDAPGKALLLAYYNVPRSDIRARWGGIPLLSGFTALVPGTSWEREHAIAVLRFERGSYRLIGVIK